MSSSKWIVLVILLLVVAQSLAWKRVGVKHRKSRGHNRLHNAYKVDKVPNYLGLLQRRVPKHPYGRFVGIGVMIDFPYFIAAAPSIALTREDPLERSEDIKSVVIEQPPQWRWPMLRKFDRWKGFEIGKKYSDIVPVAAGHSLAGSKLSLYRLDNWSAIAHVWIKPDFEKIPWERRLDWEPTGKCYIHGWSSDNESGNEVTFSKDEVWVMSCNGPICRIGTSVANVNFHEDSGAPIYCDSKLAYIAITDDFVGGVFDAVKAAHVIRDAEKAIKYDRPTASEHLSD